MLFPNKAKKAIADAFYDKVVEVLGTEETLDDEGGVVRSGGTVKSTFKANVRYNTLGELQEELGLVENIDVAITCATDTAVALNDLLQYQGKKYVATDVLPYDSHLLIVGKKWQSQ